MRPQFWREKSIYTLPHNILSSYKNIRILSNSIYLKSMFQFIIEVVVSISDIKKHWFQFHDNS